MKNQSPSIKAFLLYKNQLSKNRKKYKEEISKNNNEYNTKENISFYKKYKNTMDFRGSTVLMVSHGMGTIVDNCTKCVWIEKGKLMMIGNPKIVCTSYRQLNGSK